MAGLALPGLTPALPIAPAEAPATATPAGPGSPAPGLFEALPRGLDPAPWASSATAPGAPPDPPRATPFAGETGFGRAPYLGDAALGEVLGPLLPGGVDLSSLGPASARARPGLRETLLATPLGEEILRLAVEVFSPAIDSSGRLHVSFLGHGDLTLPRREPEPPLRSLEATADELASFSGREGWEPTFGPVPLAPAQFEAGEEPLTVGAFLALLARELVAFVTHPLTLLAALLAAAGYVAFRLALERARRHRHRSSHSRAHRHHSHHSRSHAGSSSTRRTRLPRTP